MGSKQFIAGEWRTGSLDKILVDRNPYDGSVVAEFNCASVSDIDDAYRAAERAKLEWDRVNPYAKRAVFERALRYVEDHMAEITEVIIDELGSTGLIHGLERGLVLAQVR